MRRLAWLLGAAVLVGLVGLVVFLATWEIPTPTAPVDKAIPNEARPK
jgi:hypothetical protein